MHNVVKGDIIFAGIEPNKILTVPLNIKSHDALSGWSIFKLNDDFLAGSDIENYQVILTDVQNIESYFEIKVMHEVN